MIAVLQFDAASGPRLERLSAAGRLPALSSLLDRGPRLALDCQATPDFPAATYPTLYTGQELGDHGHFYPFQWVGDDQRVHCVDSHPAASPPTIWERLARSGRRSLVIDPYESPPPHCEVGVCLSGWQLTEGVVLPRWSRPRSAWLRLAARYGRPADVTEVFGATRAKELLRLRKRLLGAPTRAADAAIRCLEHERFDLAWVNFASAHLGGHRLWEPSALQHSQDGEEMDRLSGALDEVYTAIDAGIARVVAALPPETAVIVVSPLGMAANTSRVDLLPDMLGAVLGDRAGESATALASETRGNGWIWRFRSAAPQRLRTGVAMSVPASVRRRLTARLELRGMDWGRTQAFAHPADNQGYIRLNLRGRECDGVVDPGEADELLNRIAEGLAGFRDLDGEPAVADVVRVNRLPVGSDPSPLPDLVVRWSDRPSAGLDGVVSPRFGRVLRQGAGSGRSGNHDESRAWAVIVGGAGHEVNETGDGRLADVAATVAASAGVDQSELAGRPLLRFSP